MSKVLVTDTYLTNIANAIREKNGETTTYKPGEMATAIIDLPSGGDTSMEDGLLSGTLTEYSNNRVTKICDYMFYFTTIKSFNFENVTYIGSSSFKYSKMSSFNAPKLKVIDFETFSGCSQLTAINFPLLDTMRSTGSFDGCEKLTNVNLPLAKTLPGQAFSYCEKLETVNIPEVQSIGIGAFSRCSSLCKLDLKKTSSIANNAFGNCTALNTLILRSETMCSLSNTNAFTNTLIASGTGYIYVPSTLIDAYKVATNWSTYAAQFRAIEDYPDICGEVTA